MCRFVRDKTFFCMALWREICSQIWLWCDTLQCAVVFGWFETGERQAQTDPNEPAEVGHLHNISKFDGI